MKTNIFSFSSSSLDHIAFAMAKGAWAVTKSTCDATNRARVTKCFRPENPEDRMKVGDFIMLVGTKDSGHQGIVAIGQIETLPELDSSKEYGETTTDILWGNGPWYMMFKVKFLNKLKPENIISKEVLETMGLTLTSLNAKGTQNFVPAKEVSGDQFLDIWQHLVDGAE